MVSSLDELEKLLKILRAQGATSFKANGLEVVLGDLPEQFETRSVDSAEETQMPSQAELDRAVGLPVGGLEDPFLLYNEQPIAEDEPTA